MANDFVFLNKALNGRTPIKYFKAVTISNSDIHSQLVMLVSFCMLSFNNGYRNQRKKKKMKERQIKTNFISNRSHVLRCVACVAARHGRAGHCMALYKNIFDRSFQRELVLSCLVSFFLFGLAVQILLLFVGQ